MSDQDLWVVKQKKRKEYSVLNCSKIRIFVQKVHNIAYKLKFITGKLNLNV